MDALSSDDRAVARATSPAEKLQEAFEAAELGFALKRASLRKALPRASEQELEDALERWLLSDG